MLSHLSSKFTLGPENQTHEPRAALFLNRFTRTLTIMYATSGIEQIIGIPREEVEGRSFFYCIDQTCLSDAVRCVESAKGNDSIAYLRFFYRDPRQEDPPEPSSSDSEDDVMTDITSEDDTDADTEGGAIESPRQYHSSSSSHSRSSDGIDVGGSAANSIAGRAPVSRAYNQSHSADSPRSEARDEPIELEAVISCTSDGLVVCLRRARPMMPAAQLPTTQAPQHNGIFAAPWAPQPMFLPELPQLPPYPLGAHHPAMAQAPPSVAQNAFMDSIRDVAVFAWALVGINGSLADYSQGKPIGESQPPDGFPVWDPSPSLKKESSALSGYVSGSGSGSSSSNDRDRYGFGDPGLT
jgi:hypothetical protein